MSVQSFVLRKKKQAGTPPGTIVYDGHTTPNTTELQMIQYTNESFEIVDSPSLDRLTNAYQPQVVTWIRVTGLRDTHLLQNLGEQFHIDSLLLEDVVSTHQRPKVNESKGILSVFLRTFGASDSSAYTESQISILTHKNWVISFEEYPTPVTHTILQRIVNKHGRIRARGSDYLFYTLIDTVVDGYFPLLEQLGDDLLELESSIVDSFRRQLIGSVHSLRQRVISARRLIWPLREVMSELARGDFELLQDSTVPYMRDVYDHVIQLMDVVDTYRELSAGLMDLFISIQGNKLNETMKVLTVIATIFIPLTFVVGVYGMNFNPDVSPWNMPELNWYFGYPIVLAFMAVLVAGMVAFFRHKKWL